MVTVDLKARAFKDIREKTFGAVVELNSATRQLASALFRATECAERVRLAAEGALAIAYIASLTGFVPAEGDDELVAQHEEQTNIVIRQALAAQRDLDEALKGLLSDG